MNCLCGQTLCKTIQIPLSQPYRSAKSCEASATQLSRSPMAESDSDSPLSPNHIPLPENSPSKRPKTLTLSQAPSSPPPHETAGDGSDTESQSCGICLCSEESGRAIIRGRIDSCDHYFCFVCIMEWAKVESRCPLCKRRFTGIRRPPMDGVFLNERVVNVPVRDQVRACRSNCFALFSFLSFF